MADTARAPSVSPRQALAVVAGGVGGLLLQSATITAFLGAPYVTLVTNWGRYAVAIVLVALFAALWRALPRAQAVAASIVAGAVVPSLLSRFVFGSGAPWHLLLLFGAVFAVFALACWRLALRVR